MWVEEKTARRAPGWSVQIASTEYKRARALIDYVGLILERVFSDEAEYSGYTKYRGRLQNNQGQVALDENTFGVVHEIIEAHMPGLLESIAHDGVKPFNFESFVKSLQVITDLTNPGSEIVGSMEIESGKRILFSDVKVLRKLALLRPQTTYDTSVEPGFLAR